MQNPCVKVFWTGSEEVGMRKEMEAELRLHGDGVRMVRVEESRFAY